MTAKEQGLTEWLVREMPPGTIIGDPKWWAERIAAAFPAALASDTGERGVGVPEGWALVPTSMHLDREQIEAILFHCGGVDDEGPDKYTDGLLWVGEIEGDDGTKHHGLNIATADYPEEGSSTLVEFAALRAQPAGGGCELKLRRLLAMRVAGAMLYTDDGELSDGTEHPAIDFLRNSPEEIEALLRRRAELKAAVTTLSPPESGGQGASFDVPDGFVPAFVRASDPTRVVAYFADAPAGLYTALTQGGGK